MNKQEVELGVVYYNREYCSFAGSRSRPSARLTQMRQVSVFIVEKVHDCGRTEFRSRMFYVFFLDFLRS